MTLRTRLTTRVKHIFEHAAPKSAPCFLVNYDGSPSSAAALREACEMAKPGTRVVAAFLDLVPLDQEFQDNEPVHQMLAHAILASAAVNADTYGVEIETLAIPCHAKGTALVSLASRHNNATLFLGIDESETETPLDPFADFVLGIAPLQGRFGRTRISQ